MSISKLFPCDLGGLAQIAAMHSLGSLTSPSCREMGTIDSSMQGRHTEYQSKKAVKHVQAAHLLLEYCMSDIDIGDPASVDQLTGLQLIPTMSGSLTALQESYGSRPRLLFLATRQQQEVLVSARDVLVSCKVSSRAQTTTMAAWYSAPPQYTIKHPSQESAISTSGRRHTPLPVQAWQQYQLSRR